MVSSSHTHTLAGGPTPVTPPPEIKRNVFGKLLEHLTGLHDKEFYSKSASYVEIPEESHTDMLDQALRLAQVTLEESAFVYMPEVHRENWDGGPSVVPLGTMELSNGPLGQGLPGMLSNDIDKHEAIFGIKDLNELRNARSHPGDRLFPHQLAKIDALLAGGHRVACALQNYRRATQFRALRDRLQKVGEMCWSDIVHPSVPHTPQTEWATHHERLFRAVLKDPYRIPKEIITVAKVWNRGGHPLSVGLPTGRRIRDGDGYRRQFGQNDSYFRRVNRLPFDAGTADHQAVIRTLGAPKELAEMSLEDMSRKVADIKAKEEKWDLDAVVVVQTEWIGAGKEVTAEAQVAVDAGLFNN